MLTPSRDLRRVRVARTMVGALPKELGESVFVSLFGVPNSCVIKRLRFYSGDIPVDTDHKITIRILSDPARYRAAEAATAGSGEPYVLVGMDSVTSSASPNTYWLKDVSYSSDVVYRDDLKSSCLHLMLESATLLDADATFTIEAEVEGLPNILLTQDTDHFLGQKNLQILRWSSGNIWTDLTRDLFNWSQNADASLSLFTAATDVIYIGSPDPIDALMFDVHTFSTNAGATSTLNFWNGSTWAALTTVYDNCMDANSNGSEINFASSGVITWEPQTNWRKARLGDLSLGTPPYDHWRAESFAPDHYWDEKYWLALSFDDIANQATFRSIRRAGIF